MPQYSVYPGYFRVFLCLMVALFSYHPGEAQVPGKPFAPVAINATLLGNLHDTYLHQYKEELNQLPSQNRKDYQDIYEERWKNIEEKFTNQEIYTSAEAQAYLDRLVAEITANNPFLSAHPFHCYFSRSAVPNASYIGEGIILFNMGLFYRLSNESEAAFILCHEMAHCYLQHPEKSIGKYVATVNSEEVQAQLRKIKGAEYRKREQLQSLVKGLAFDSRRHSRDHESEADSMAVVLMRHTRFSPKGALTTLALLDVIDKDTFDVERGLRQTFDSKEYPFRKKWLAREEGLLGGHAHLKEDSVMADSLKTHPDCQKRILLLRPMIGVAGGRRFVVDSSAFARLQDLFRYEVIEYAFTSKMYTESLFLDLQLQRTRVGDAYLVSQTGRILNGLYTAQKGHTLGKVVDMPSPYYPENYNRLLQWVQNLYLEDIASINHFYLKAYHPGMDEYPAYKQSFEECEKIFATIN